MLGVDIVTNSLSLFSAINKIYLLMHEQKLNSFTTLNLYKLDEVVKIGVHCISNTVGAACSDFC